MTDKPTPFPFVVTQTGERVVVDMDIPTAKKVVQSLFAAQQEFGGHDAGDDVADALASVIDDPWDDDV